MGRERLPPSRAATLPKRLQTLPPAQRAEKGAIMDCFVNVPELGGVRIHGATHEAQARPVNALLLRRPKQRLSRPRPNPNGHSQS